MNMCCMDHDIKDKMREEEIGAVLCVCDTEDIKDLLKPAPLRIIYQSFTIAHRKLQALMLECCVNCVSFS